MINFANSYHKYVNRFLEINEAAKEAPAELIRQVDRLGAEKPLQLVFCRNCLRKRAFQQSKFLWMIFLWEKVKPLF